MSSFMKPDSILSKKNAVSMAFIIVTFSILAIFEATQIYNFIGNLGPFWRYLLGCTILWFYWGFAMPIILQVCRRFPFEAGNWARLLATHLACWIIFTIPKIFLAVFVFTYIYQFMGENDPYLQTFQKLLLGGIVTEFLTYICIVGACIAFDYRKKYRERELYALQLQMQLSAAELSVLKMQLQPHFLFNTLHTVSMLIRLQDYPTAILVNNGLSELLRRSLEQTGKLTVSLQEELELTDCYIDIEKLRFQDQITITKNISPDVLNAIVPNLLLQPLVENAIRHGLSKRASGGLIEISARREMQNIKIEVNDNGYGTKDELLLGKGIGLTNTKERLAHLYGTSHAFLINQDNGFSVSITIPYTT